MRKVLSLSIASSILAACTADPMPGSSSQAASSSSANTQQSSAPALSSSSIASSSSSAPADNLTGNFADGEAVYKASCQGCHANNEDGTFGQNQTGFVGRLFVVGQQLYDNFKVYPNDKAGLQAYILDQMPPGTPLNAQQAADVTEYLWSFKNDATEIELISATCESTDPVYYGQRSLKLLTSFEYANSVKRLFAQPVDEAFLVVDGDSNIANMPNHTSESISYSRMETYHQNASKIADWAVNTPAAWTFNCGNPQSATCADVFVNNFAYMAFRRPLTSAERQTYMQMITGSDSGLRWAFHSVLMSPQFLYRSELGVKVSDAKSDPSFLTGGNNGGAGNAADYEMGAGAVTVNGANFATKGSGEAIAGFGYNMYTNGTSTQQFNFPDPALVSLTVKANDMDMMWPLMELSVGQTMIAAETVATYDAVTYTYLVTGVQGNQNLSIAFNNDDGREPYGVAGNDIDLHVGDVTVGPAIPKSNDVEIGETDPLLQADDSAYVLDAYEHASALAYIFTGAGPDKALLDAAGRGDLNDPVKLESQIDRLLDSAEGREQVGRFAGMWLRTDKVVTKSRDAAGFTDAVRASMAQEVRELYKHYFYGNEPFAAIYEGNTAVLDKTLSDYYGVPSNSSGHMNFVPVDTSSNDQRGGLLTLGAFMVVNSHDDRTSPIHRAVHVRQDMLCHNIPLPAAGALQAERDAAIARAQEREAEGDLSTWEFYNIQTNYREEDPTDTTTDACESCHQKIINPLAVMEDYDNAGRFRTSQRGLGPNGRNGVAIKTEGVLWGVNGVVGEQLNESIPLTGGAKGLSRELAKLEPVVNACLIEKSFRFATATAIKGESVVSGEKALTTEQQNHFVCVAEDLATQMSDNNGSPRAMLKALGMSDVIRFRK